MFYDPSPPVFVDTNRASTSGPFEDRFYLDLNRNTNFEQTGFLELTDDNFRVIPGVKSWVVGDPQWIGVLQDPSRPHAPDNRFIGRYAFLIQPIGRSLDLNWIHNQALGLTNSPGLDMRQGQFNGFYRNQGVGPWELNLAGFLADLNTNSWGNYQFYPFNPVATGVAPTTSSAFNDARELF